MPIKVLNVIPWYEVPEEELNQGTANLRPVGRSDLSGLSEEDRKYAGQSLYLTDLLSRSEVDAAVLGKALKGDEEAVATIYSLILRREKTEEKATEVFNSLVFFRTNNGAEP